MAKLFNGARMTSATTGVAGTATTMTLGSAVGAVLYARDLLHGLGYVAVGFVAVAVTMVAMTKPRPGAASAA